MRDIEREGERERLNSVHAASWADGDAMECSCQESHHMAAGYHGTQSVPGTLVEAHSLAKAQHRVCQAQTETMMLL